MTLQALAAPSALSEHANPAALLPIGTAIAGPIMAHSEELATACRMVDQDYEATGTVTPMTVALLRKLLSTIDGA